MNVLLSVAFGGALGALARFGVSNLYVKLFGDVFPYGTLIANVLGCFIIGFLAFYFAGKIAFTPAWQGLLIVGFLGAFTTFSTFSLQTMKLINTGAIHLAMANIVLNLGLCIIAVYVGAGLGNVFK